MRQSASRLGNTNLVALLRSIQGWRSLLATLLLMFAPALFADSGLVSDRGTVVVRWIEIEPGEQPRAARNFDECVIYAPDPGWVLWTGSLGHELAHCFTGAYHPQSGHIENWGPWNEKKTKKKDRKNAG